MSHYTDPTDARYTSVYKEQTPEMLKAFLAFDSAVFAAEGPELPLKVRELIAVAVALTTQCSYCIEAHSENAMKAGATLGELAEASWVASAIRAGGGFAHGRMAFKFAQPHAHAA
ncbi:carboxymuconolactone decarboxylase family protein [Cellulomonas sp. ACRRI]|uniref:carboxymuconolactone decarboxylase family protein n=1 Tax=Cellulomonas sp. ACRRI TaxID=2918188 RepID=UPI001EF33A76|nr:carboxymuconolactone decarboxylase family protein [Cellulomonas sp. ACRRI]MCG7284873.1 carboxymuconolactone decarboxylase family protein [Cellulomonas sp. ACRRI]